MNCVLQIKYKHPHGAAASTHQGESQAACRSMQFILAVEQKCPRTLFHRLTPSLIFISGNVVNAKPGSPQVIQSDLRK
jgi:hypothetical protein